MPGVQRGALYNPAAANALLALSPSPPLSPNNYKMDRQRSNSPPHPPTKRDKRRNMLSDRLSQMMQDFTVHRDVHYRDQLQGLQIDMNLMLEANVHGDSPIPDYPYEIHELVKNNMKKMKSVGPQPPTRAGRVYEEFAREVNGAMEERDVALTTHKRNYDVKMSELESAHAYRIKLADNEYRTLASTLRDRLLNSVTAKKARLFKDKETIEIGENHALLLHPSQYSLNNESSPGVHSKRTTRLRRDADEAPNFAEGSKRKRKAVDRDESPAPARQRNENGTSTPIWTSERNMQKSMQIESGLYSMDKLFTARELALSYNDAALEAHEYMVRHPPYAEDTTFSPNGRSDSSSQNGRAAGDGENNEAESPPAGAMMERQFSHATRSTRAGGPNYLTLGTGIEIIGDLKYPSSMQHISASLPRIPPHVANTMIKSYTKGENTPAGLTPEELNAEMEIIKRARTFNDEHGFGKNLGLEHGGKTLLEVVSKPRERMAYFTKVQKGTGTGTGTMLSNLREELGVDAESAQGSRQASMMGGTGMSRQGTGDGRRK